jgi:hypothetical protein
MYLAPLNRGARFLLNKSMKTFKIILCSLAVSLFCSVANADTYYSNQSYIYREQMEQARRMQEYRRMAMLQEQARREREYQAQLRARQQYHYQPQYTPQRYYYQKQYTPRCYYPSYYTPQLNYSNRHFSFSIR